MHKRKKGKTRGLHSSVELIPQIAFNAKAGDELELANLHWFNNACPSKEFPESNPDAIDIFSIWKNQ